MPLIVRLRERFEFLAEGCCKLCFHPHEPEIAYQEPYRPYLLDVCLTCRRKEKNRVHSNNNRRRLRRHGRERGTLVFTEWMATLKKTNYGCSSCGRKGRHNLTLDHKIAINSGGKNEISNVQPLCKKCHAAKDNYPSSIRSRSLGFYRRFRRWLRSKTGISLPRPRFHKEK